MLQAEPQSKDRNEVITVDLEGKTFAIRHADLLAVISRNRWSYTGTPFSIDRFRDKTEDEVLVAALYRQIEHFVRRYYWTPEVVDYIIIPLYVMLTYYFEVYDAIPYLAMKGPMDSGKTTLCSLLQHLAFNGIMSPDVTKDMVDSQITLIIDEQEAIRHFGLIKSAYKRAAGNGDSYHPIVIANVSGLEDMLKTRAIPINTHVAPVSAPIRQLRSSDPAFLEEVQLIRDRTYCFVLQNHAELRELPELQCGNEITNRSRELFQPLLALATFIEESDGGGDLNLVEPLIQALPVKNFRRQYQDSDPVQALKDACLSILAEKGAEADWVTLFEIVDKLQALGTYEKAMTLQWIGKQIVENAWVSPPADCCRKIVTTCKRDSRTCKVIDPAKADKPKVTVYRLNTKLMRGEL